MKKHLTSILLFFIVVTVARAAAAEPVFEFENMAPQDAQTVYSVAQDATGMMWVGTENGLYSYDGYGFNACFTHGERSNTRVYAILVHGGILYLGTDNGLLLYSLRTGRYVEQQDAEVKNSTYNTGEVRALCLAGRFVLCGAASGLYRYDTSDGRFSKLPHRISNVYSLLWQDNRLLAGTISGLYIIKVHGANPCPCAQVGSRWLTLCSPTAAEEYGSAPKESFSG